MNAALWVAQILLALAFGAAGIIKITQPHEKLAASMGWPSDFSPGFVRFIGAAELLGALGLILPAVTGIAPVLVRSPPPGSPSDRLVRSQCTSDGKNLRSSSPTSC